MSGWTLFAIGTWLVTWWFALGVLARLAILNASFRELRRGIAQLYADAQARARQAPNH